MHVPILPCPPGAAHPAAFRPRKRHNARMAARIVYSTGIGMLCPNCRRAVRDCVCPKGAPGAAKPAGVRVGRETKGRAGKGVTTITGLPLPLRADRCARGAAEEALWVGRYGAQRRHRNSGRSPRSDRCGTCQIGLARKAIRRIAIRVSCMHREKSCLESVLFSEDRRRRNRPETLRHTNYSLWRSLESDRAVSPHQPAGRTDPPKGSSAHRCARSLRSKDRGAASTPASLG